MTDHENDSLAGDMLSDIDKLQRVYESMELEPTSIIESNTNPLANILNEEVKVDLGEGSDHEDNHDEEHEEEEKEEVTEELTGDQHELDKDDDGDIDEKDLAHLRKGKGKNKKGGKATEDAGAAAAAAGSGGFNSTSGANVASSTPGENDGGVFKPKLKRKPKRRQDESLKSQLDQLKAKEQQLEARLESLKRVKINESYFTQEADDELDSQIDALPDGNTMPPADVPPEGTEDPMMADVVSMLQDRFPGASISVTVEMPEDQPFEPDIMAQAEELAGVEQPEEEEMDAMEPPMRERREKINDLRDVLNEVYEDLEDEQGEETPELDAEAPVDMPTGDEEGMMPTPEREVSDTKITLPADEWEAIVDTGEVAEPGMPAGDMPEVPGADLPPDPMNNRI